VSDRIAAYAAKLPKGVWILGDEWMDAVWGGQLPSRRWLDAVAPDHPVWLLNGDRNIGIANSVALRVAGIGRDTPDEGMGTIVRDKQGEATGVIRGGPMWRMDAALLERSWERDSHVVEAGIAKLIRTGVTSVHHNNSWQDFLILQRLHQTGRLQLRVYASPELPGWQRLRDYIAAHGRGDDWLHWGAVKGYGVITAEAYYPRVSGAAQAGLQVMVHTGGNDELRALLGVFERVRREQNLRDPRFRVEHGHDMPADAIPRMAQAGAIASWQPPLLAHEDQHTAAGQPAPTNLFPCRALLNAGVKIAFGTDSSPWISGVIAPVESLEMALQRAAPDGTRITLDEALRAFTADAAYAEFAEREKGSLEAGKLADFVLFDRDFSRGPAHGISAAKVRMTVIGGRVAWE
jgi:predicted amidohydrolase YtcJ